MKVFKAPHRSVENLPPIKIFLAGSIEMGVAEDWQTRITNELSEYDVIIYNPRRDDWDSSWKQDPTDGTPFHEQVTWELEHIDESDVVLFYFDPATKSPITLMELGLCLGSSKENVFICCPQDYFRYGNVAVTAKYWGDNKVYINEDDWVVDIKMYLEQEYAHKKVVSEEIVNDENIVSETIVQEESIVEENEEISNTINSMYSYYNILSESKNENLNDYIRGKYNNEHKTE